MCLPMSSAVSMWHCQNDSFEFTYTYIAGLRNRDPEIQQHFAEYFTRELDRWLRPRLRHKTAIEDIRQETLTRVLDVVRRENALRHAHRLPAFVNKVCRNVLREYWRKTSKSEDLDPRIEIVHGDSAEQRAQAAEKYSCLREALMRIPKHDRAVLTMLYFEEEDRSEAGRRMGVSQAYLRVLVHRATKRLRVSFLNCLAQSRNRPPAAQAA